jgi:hypothetical protein
MTPERRKEELIQGLSNTGNDEVYLAINQVAEVLGIEAAVKLAVPGTLSETQEALQVKRVQGVRTVTKSLRGGNAEFNRGELLKALQKHKFEDQPEPEDQF